MEKRPEVNGRSEGYTFLPSRGPGIAWLVLLVAIPILLGGLLPAGLAIYYGRVQRNLEFTLSSTGLDVAFKMGRISVAAGDIADVQFVAEPPQMIRTGGASLGDFQMGWYRLPEFGSVYRLTTGRAGYVYVDVAANTSASTSARPSTRYVLSPEDPERFADLAAEVWAGRGPTTPVLFRPFPGGPVSTWALVWISALVVPVGVILPWILVKGKRGLQYHVGPEGITVHHLGHKLYRWDEIEDVVIREDPLGRLRRLLGTGVPGYYAGTFRTQTFDRLQMNGTRAKPPLLIVKTKALHIALTPEDMDGFMRAVEEYRNPE